MRDNMREDLVTTRRTLLQGVAALGVSALIAGEALEETAFAQDESTLEAAPKSKEVQYGFLVKLANCSGCNLCVDACKLRNAIPEEYESHRKVNTYFNEIGKKIFVSTSCMHCAVPSCMAVCPAGAISKGEGGIVVVDQERCIGCKYCYQACPFGVPHYTSAGMDKCDCCQGNGLPLGEEPYCVKACKFDALRYGPIKDLLAESHGKAQPIIASTGPSYLLMR